MVNLEHKPNYLGDGCGNGKARANPMRRELHGELVREVFGPHAPVGGSNPSRPHQGKLENKNSKIFYECEADCFASSMKSAYGRRAFHGR